MMMVTMHATVEAKSITPDHGIMADNIPTGSVKDSQQTSILN